MRTLRETVTQCAWCHKVLDRRWTYKGGIRQEICPRCVADDFADYLRGSRGSVRQEIISGRYSR